MPLVKVKRYNQVTIPKKLSRELGINEGDYVELSREGNKLYIEPVRFVKKDLTKVWREQAKQMETSTLSEEGEKMLLKALEDKEKGRFEVFDDVEELISGLKE